MTPQKGTSSYHIDEANRLSLEIDAAMERPDDLLKQFDFHVNWLERYTDVIISDTVRCPENW